MSMGTRGELNDDRPTHPEGNISNGMVQTVVDHWGDQSMLSDVNLTNNRLHTLINILLIMTQ